MTYSMKIGIVAFNRSWRFMNGGVTCADVYKQILTHNEFDADIIAVNFSSCPFDFPGYDKKYDLNEHEWDEALKQYDRLVILNYASLGREPSSRWYTNRLLKVIDSRDSTSYVFVLPDEFSCTGIVISDLIKHGIRDRWMFNSEEVQHYIGSGLGIRGAWFNHITPRKLNVLLEDKKRGIHYVGRLNEEQKFILTLLTVCSSLNIDLELYGPVYKPLFDTIAKLPQPLHLFWEKSYKGRCEEPIPAMATRRPFRFSWGVVRGYKEGLQRFTGFTGDFMPRIEQSVTESIRTGSVPILVCSTIPEWFPHEYAITLDSYDVPSMTEQLESKLVYNASTVERLNECNKLLDKRMELSMENLRRMLNL